MKDDFGLLTHPPDDTLATFDWATMAVQLEEHVAYLNFNPPFRWP